MTSTSSLGLLVLVLSYYACSCSFAQDLVCSPSSISPQEVETLHQIAREVKKSNWSCSENPCFDNPNGNCWRSKEVLHKYTNLVNCTCGSDGRWHVSHIYWKGQNLSGVLPKSLAKLPYIKTIDLSRNVLSGTIPRSWADTNLEFVSLFANRLSGSIPSYLGKIVTLTQISIESNEFSGTIPPELGNLINMTNLTLSDNKLTGPLPAEFKNLTKLTTLQLSSNNFSGILPDIFQNYPGLQHLDVISSGFEGPIPTSISSLQNINDLRISDLGGADSKFPPLQNLTKLKTLVLRSCNITGEISQDIRDLRLLETIDFSFNKLTGSLPYNPLVTNLYLTGNMLNGSIPKWILDTDDTSHIDLSYNNFDASHVEASCGRETLNLYRCNAKEKTLDSSACLKGVKCSKVRYSVHINCGGEELKIGKITYEQDTDISGAATFFQKNANWGFSSSGVFYKLEKRGNNYIAQSTSIKSNDIETDLYKEARLSATSLTYYGRCLAKGNYTVTLYFSEIVFTDDDTYASLGRRLFDIYIQEELYEKDFDIVKEANGTHKPLKKTFANISVIHSIEIRFYYAGKGSTQIPLKGNYGPLISAISVESQFNPPFNWKRVVWVLLGAISSLTCAALGFLWWKRRKENIRSREQELRVLNPQIGIFSYKQIKAACNNFIAANKLGEGGFGPVYKGTLLDGTDIAVKQLSAKSSQGNREFVNEIGMISSLYHPNLVKLYGCCVDTGQLLLVYEYLENKDLGRVLFGPDDGRLILDWSTRKKICIGIARGLAFLHEESSIKIIHRDIKASNILLNRDLNPKISDFGLARLNEEDITHISTRIAGTIGYMAPEYALWGFLTPKADLYSFGVVTLEVIAGRSNMKFQPNEDHFCLLDWAFVQKQKDNLTEVIDPTLGTNYDQEEALKMIEVALLCTNPSPALRPTISEALSMIEGKTKIHELVLEPNRSYSHEWMYQASTNKHRQQMSEAESQSLIHSSNAPSETESQSLIHSSYALSIESSSKSVHDLYAADTVAIDNSN